MTDEQFNKMMAMLEVIAQNTAVIAAQGHFQRPLTGPEYGKIADSVRRTVEMIAAGIDIGVLPPGNLAANPQGVQ